MKVYAGDLSHEPSHLQESFFYLKKISSSHDFYQTLINQ